MPGDRQAFERLIGVSGIGIFLIARHVDLRESVRILASARPSLVDPYLVFITETLAKYPTLRASRLYAMVRERGYPGRQQDGGAGTSARELVNSQSRDQR